MKIALVESIIGIKSQENPHKKQATQNLLRIQKISNSAVFDQKGFAFYSSPIWRYHQSSVSQSSDSSVLSPLLTRNPVRCSGLPKDIHLLEYQSSVDT